MKHFLSLLLLWELIFCFHISTGQIFPNLGGFGVPFNGQGNLEPRPSFGPWKPPTFGAEPARWPVFGRPSNRGAWKPPAFGAERAPWPAFGRPGNGGAWKLPAFSAQPATEVRGPGNEEAIRAPAFDAKPSPPPTSGGPEIGGDGDDSGDLFSWLFHGQDPSEWLSQGDGGREGKNGGYDLDDILAKAAKDADTGSQSDSSDPSAFLQGFEIFSDFGDNGASNESNRPGGGVKLPKHHTTRPHGRHEQSGKNKRIVIIDDRALDDMR